MFNLELLTLEEYKPVHGGAVQLFIKDFGFGIGFTKMKDFDVEIHYAEHEPKLGRTGHSAGYDGDDSFEMNRPFIFGVDGIKIILDEPNAKWNFFQKEYYFKNGSDQVHPCNDDHGIIGIIDSEQFREQMDAIYNENC